MRDDRRGRGAPEPTPEDLRRYRDLVDVATRAAADPQFDPGKVRKARAACKGRVLPKGQQYVGSAFALICGLTQAWESLTPEGREAQRAHLGLLADRCRSVLDPPPARPRADVEG